MTHSHKKFVRTSILYCTVEELYAWHSNPDALKLLTPPWMQCTITADQEGIHEGNQVLLRIRKGLVRFNWLARQTNVLPPGGFEDIQVTGPFAHWHHTHRFTRLGPSHCRLEDIIEYDLPLRAVLNGFACVLVEPELRRLFAFRHRVTKSELEKARAQASEPVAPGSHQTFTTSS